MTTQQDRTELTSADEERRRAEARVGARVLQALGPPPGWHRVQVRRLGQETFRVNVLVGADAATATIAHSYFLVADGDGNITESSPAVLRRY